MHIQQYSNIYFSPKVDYAVSHIYIYIYTGCPNNIYSLFQCPLLKYILFLFQVQITLNNLRSFPFIFVAINTQITKEYMSNGHSKSEYMFGDTMYIQQYHNIYLFPKVDFSLFKPAKNKYPQFTSSTKRLNFLQNNTVK